VLWSVASSRMKMSGGSCMTLNLHDSTITTHDCRRLSGIGLKDVPSFRSLSCRYHRVVDCTITIIYKKIITPMQCMWLGGIAIGGSIPSLSVLHT